MSYRATISIILVTFLVTSGCSSKNSPLNPQNDFTLKSNAVAGRTGSVLPWGFWEVTLIPDTSSAQIIPLRTLEFTANVTQFMQPPLSKKHLMGIKIDDLQTDWATGHVVVDVSFTHPFPGLKTYTGFDVRGVCIGNGSLSGVQDPGIIYAGPEDLRVLNADGLTRWFNPSEFTTYGTIFGFTLGKLGTPSTNFSATLNGYKYYADQINKDTDIAQFFADTGCPNPRGYFSAGNTLTRTYDLQFPAPGGVPKYTFQYAVIASWEPPLVDPPVNIPDDFSLSANCHEAYVISVLDKSTLYYISPSEKGGELIVDVKVFDHQGTLNSAGVADEISRINIESSEGLINGNLASFDAPALASALIESNSLFARYVLTVPETSVNPTSTGSKPLLVSVESAKPSTYDSGFSGFAFPNGALAAYVSAKVNVGSTTQNKPPVAIAEATSSTNIPSGFSVKFDGSASYDPDGTIVSWEWDSNEDGIYNDATGPTPSIIFPTQGIFNVDLRVTDNKGATDTLDVKIKVTVTAKVIYVDVNNTTPPWDGTLANPFQIIQHGVDAVPDDTGWMVYIFPGTYTNSLYMENPSDPQNTPGGVVLLNGKKNITIYGENGAVIKPPSNTTFQKAAIRLRNNCQNITLDNLTFSPTYYYQSAVWMDGGSGLTVKNCSIKPPNASYGYLEFLRTQNTSDVIADNNEMNTFNSASTFMSVFVINSGSNIKITRNNVYKLNYWVGHNSYQTSESYVGMSNVNGGEVSKNKFGGEHYRSASSSNYVQSIGINISSGSNIVVRNNLIYDTYFYNSSGTESRNIGIWVQGTASNIQIYNNTIDLVGPPSSGTGTGYTYGIAITGTNPQIVHSNIITNLRSPSLASCFGVFSTPSQTSDYSCVWNMTGGTAALYGGNASAGTGSISQNPMFVNPAAYNYQLQAGSPCKGTGKDGVDMGCYGGPDPLE